MAKNKGISVPESGSWKDAEVMVVGSGGLGPILRVFLDSNSGKIVCNSSVPCIILPRGGEVDAA
jgi:nucleotide-binding universal stress UspA family protein